MRKGQLTKGEDDPKFVITDTHSRGFIVQPDITLYISWFYWQREDSLPKRKE